MFEEGFHRSWLLTLLAFGATLLAACADPSKQILGEWKGQGPMGYNEDIGEFLPDGSCKLLRAGARQYCAWVERGGTLQVRFSADNPDSTLRAVIKDDQMWLMEENKTESSWVRLGSELDKSVAAYTKGQQFIQAGDYEQGIAALKEAADRGFEGGQNSLAWVYATAKDPRFQNGKKAVEYAEKVIAQNDDYPYQDTYAAALARDGQFKKAIDVETEALSQLRKDTDLPVEERKAAEQRYRGRIGLYQAGQAYTEP